MKILFGYLFVITFAISFLACSSDPISESSDTDSLLRQALNSNGGLNDFVLPESSQFDLIPQDPKNPITKEKVALGGFLFHETALSIDAKEPGNKKTFSCASCHHAAAGFQAGTFQGIGEGGVGFGLRGEGRTPAPRRTRGTANQLLRGSPDERLRRREHDHRRRIHRRKPRKRH